MAGPEDITFFSAVDRTKEPDFFRRFLDEGNKVPGIIASKPIILAGLQLTGGEKVLDVGCGLGDDTFEIARLVGRQGRAIGVDVSKSMILEARHRAAAHDLAAEFEVGDAQALRFEDATFDACHPAETPSDWVTTSTPVSARFTVAISSASPAIFSSLGWSTGILRADRASARTECPPSTAALTVSRPIPLLAPMIRTIATASCSWSDPPGSPSCAMQAAAPQDGRAA